MSVSRVVKQSFTVIGIEGSTNDGAVSLKNCGMRPIHALQKLWIYASVMRTVVLLVFGAQ